MYDGTSKKGEVPLRSAWAAGARLYRVLGRIDGYHGARSWSDALEWLATFRAPTPIAHLQFWGHGHWGRAMIAGDVLDQSSFDASSPLRPGLDRLRHRLLPDGESLIWFRTCETFGADSGKAFARRLTTELQTRAAGHTYVIGPLQSGLHGLRPGAEPSWSAIEGLSRGTAERPISALMSTPSAPQTVHFLDNSFDDAWFDS